MALKTVGFYLKKIQMLLIAKANVSCLMEQLAQAQFIFITVNKM